MIDDILALLKKKYNRLDENAKDYIEWKLNVLMEELDGQIES